MDNIDNNTIEQLKNMMNKGELDNIMSQISPEMIQNFSNMMNSSQSTSSTDVDSKVHNSSGNNQNGFDFKNIDMNTMLKMKSVIEKMNNSNDPRANLLHSLKPYLREERKSKVDQYANLLNFANIAELLKNDDNKENKKNE